MSSSTTQQDACQASIDILSKAGVNLLALDFDQTIVDTHTGGRWPDTAEELHGHVRTEFRQLVVHLLLHPPSPPIHVVIVTFSGQVDLIQNVLELVLASSGSCTKAQAHDIISQQVIIRGRDHSWKYEGNGMKEGKQPYMASAAEELHHKHDGLEITRRSTLLIDDDPDNVRLALQDGTRAVWFNPDRPHHLWKEVRKLAG